MIDSNAKWLAERRKVNSFPLDYNNYKLNQTKSKKEIERAKQKYESLAKLGSQLTRSNGLLILASCSSRVHAEDFFEINNKALKSTKREFEMIRSTLHDTDHPVGFEEGAYLKTGYYLFSK